MKKTTIILSLVLFVASCATEQKKEEAKEESKPLIEEEKKDPDVEKGLSLVGQSDCLTCHKVNEPFTGPAYTAVSARYAGRTDVVDSLADKIIKGGAGNWGAIPMTPHPAISKEDARAMVKYVLSLKQE
jgi:cytochrome c